MLRSVEDMYGYQIQATDAEVGHVDDFYFDTGFWSVRYLVVETGNWLQVRHVLLVPEVLQEPNWMAGILPVRLTAQEIRESPETNLSEILTRQHEEELHTHYGWDYYWLTLKSPLLPEEMDAEAEGDFLTDDEITLTRTREVDGYGVLAQGEDVGHIVDFLVADDDWVIYYLVVDTGSWLPGRKVVLSTQWIDQFDTTHAKIHVNVSRNMIEGSPEYTATAPVDRAFEEKVYDYYARPKYWI